MKHKNVFDNIAGKDIFDISTPHIEFSANKSATVEGCKGIIEYTCDCVRINCDNIIIKFVGSCLELEALTTERICVSGTIIAMEFLT